MRPGSPSVASAPTDEPRGGCPRRTALGHGSPRLSRPMLAFDWSIVERYGPAFLSGAAMTLAVSVVATLAGLALGLLAALPRLSPWRPLPALARACGEVVGGPPLLVQLFFIYAALPFYGIRLSALAAGTVALSLYCGAL